MKSRVSRSIALAGLAVIGVASFGYANPITVPSGLTPGQSYRLVFVTSTTTTAQSASIAFYNSFVTTAANSNATLAALDTTWVAIASTTTVNAIDNIGVDGVPLYNLDGQEVATSDGLAGLWSGGLLHSIDYNQNGISVGSVLVWTGTNPSGTAQAPAGPVTTEPLGDGLTVPGLASSVTSTWVYQPQGLFGEQPQFLNAVYGISGVLTYEPAGASVPEPASLSLVILGGMFLRKRQRRADSLVEAARFE